MWRKTLALLLSILLLNACTPALPIPATFVAMPTGTSPVSRSVAHQTESPTPIPPTATEAPAEIDLKINYEQKVSTEYMGVKIDASLITDESLEPTITKVTVGDSAYAEFVARSIYKVWLKKGGLDGTGPAAATAFEEFMKLWSTAQQSGKEEDWRQVQIKNIWANDIPTPGYVQQPYTFWFMHEGQTPEDVKGISKMSIVLMNGVDTKNITNFNDKQKSSGYLGMGTNLDREILYIYHGFAMNILGVYGNNTGVADAISITPLWLNRNLGGSFPGSLDQSKDLASLLLNGDLAVYR